MRALRARRDAAAWQASLDALERSRPLGRQPACRRSSRRCSRGRPSARSPTACARSSASTARRSSCEPAGRRVRRLLFRLRVEEAVGAAVRATDDLADGGRLLVRARGRRARARSTRAASRGWRPSSCCWRRWRSRCGAGRRRRSCRACARRCPLLACFLIYTNLHDTIGFVNPHDVHHDLVALDRAIFGVQPCVWAERLITPGRTEVMQFLYLNFFWIAPSTSLILLLQRALARVPRGDRRHHGLLLPGLRALRDLPGRAAAAGARGRVHEEPARLPGRLLGPCRPGRSRCCRSTAARRSPRCTPRPRRWRSIYAWRHARWWFWVLLPFVLGLWASTIYLRHHYFVDLVGGWLLAPVALWLAPRVDALVGAAAAGARLRAGEGRRQAPVRRDEGPAERTAASRRDDAAAYFAGWRSTDQACVPQASVSSWPSPFGAKLIVNRSAGCAALAAVIGNAHDLLAGDRLRVVHQWATARSSSSRAPVSQIWPSGTPRSLLSTKSQAPFSPAWM